MIPGIGDFAGGLVLSLSLTQFLSHLLPHSLSQRQHLNLNLSQKSSQSLHPNLQPLYLSLNLRQ
jgi:hypothetical protein